MDIKRWAPQVLAALDTHYPYNNECYLHHNQPHELLFATILSARCTDERVNLTTRDLFVKYPSLADFASADLTALEQDIKSTGFFRSKAKNIIAAAAQLLKIHGGNLPSDVESLTELPGVGRKTANVVRCHIFKIPAIVVDTHVMRVSRRWGFTANTDPTKIEFDLMALLPKTNWIRYNHQVIVHGRQICKGPKAKCHTCFLAENCPKN